MAELLLFLILGAFMWLLNGALPEWLRRRQNEVPQDVARQGLPVVLHVPRLQTPPTVAPRSVPSPAVPSLVAIRQREPVWLGSRRDIRRGMILMTILGPCRALEPPEPPR
jgi:hypothetical protein